MVDAFAPACVVLVTINDQDPAFYRDPTELDNATALNTWIRGVAGAQVADWAAYLQSSYFDTDAQGDLEGASPE